MAELMPFLAVVAILGAGVVTGLLFAFSNFALQALADLPPAQGMHAMQRINARILNPVFFLFFFGTPLLCLGILAGVVLDDPGPGSGTLALGAITYLAGPFCITAFGNVPLNKQLAQVSGAEAEPAWSDYRRRWQRWNHIRTALGMVSVVLLGSGLVMA